MKQDFFKNKTIIITGASEGIGAATAERFYELGANLILIARRENILTEFANTFKDKTRIKTFAMDVLNYTLFEEVLKETKKLYGGIDILINNAGANHRGPLMTITPEQIENVIAVNLTAPIILTRLILPYFEEQKKGLIINVASLAGRTPVDNAAIYSGSKFGIRAFSKALSYEYDVINKNIRCCVISPGPIYTNFVMQNIDAVADLVFSQPISTAYDVADMIVATAKDYKMERVSGGFVTGLLTNMGYLFPWLKRLLNPFLLAKGRRVKKHLKNKPLPIR